MPQERDNPYPVTTAEEVEAAPGSREQKSARFVIVRHITGNPRRGYLLGDCDHAPVYQGVTDLTAAAWAVLDEIPPDQLNGTLGKNAAALRAILTDHGCPAEGEAE